MDTKSFREKYGHLNTYDKYLDYILKLHGDIVYHQNTYFIEYMDSWNKQVQGIAQKIVENSEDISKLKNEFKVLDNKPIYLTKEFKSAVSTLEFLAHNLNNTFEALDRNKDAASLKFSEASTEMTDLIQFVESRVAQFYSSHHKYRGLNTKIIGQITEQGLQLMSLADRPVMRNVYDEVMKGLVNENIGPSPLEEYKIYKEKQKQNKEDKNNIQKQEVITYDPSK